MTMVNFPKAVPLLPLVFLGIACNDQAPDDPTFPIAVHVQTEQGQAVSNVAVDVTIWHDTSSDLHSRLLLRDLTSVTFVDTLTAGEQVDSIHASVGGLECTAFGASAATIIPSPRASRSVITLMLPRIRSRAALAPGVLCGLGVDGTPALSNGPYSVYLRIDSITDSLRGVWAIRYSPLHLVEDGALVGGIVGDSVRLDLAPASTVLCNAHRTFTISLRADTLRTGRLVIPSGCAPAADTVALFAAPAFPFP
jgi:hypothetical protein